VDKVARTLAGQLDEIAALKAELDERRSQYRAVLENNPHPTWVYALDSLRFLDVNEVATRAYGWSRDEFLEMTIADIRPPEDVRALLSNVARMRARPGGITGPWRHRYKDGTIVEVVISYLSFPFFGQPARLIIAAESQKAPHLPDLSPRERQVFELVARGHTSHDIAARLALSPKSVETYRARFMTKLGLRTRADIVEYAIAHGALAG